MGDKINEKNILLFLKQFRENFRSKTTRFREIKSFFRDAKWCFDASWGFKGLKWFLFCGDVLRDCHIIGVFTLNAQMPIIQAQ